MQFCTVVIFTHHPPARLPPSPVVSSVTYRLHTPLGSIPLNTLNALPPDGAGAGAGNTSAPPAFVGLNVPLTSGPESGRLLAAASSSVNVTPLTAVEPPTSDMMIAFCPPGPTSNMSMSSGKVWLKLLSVTVTLVTAPVTPEIDSSCRVRSCYPISVDCYWSRIATSRGMCL